MPNKLKNKILSLSVFDEPRPRYVSKVTFFDKIFAATILKLFPRSVRPNFLTVFRFVSIPFVVILLLAGAYEKALWLFAISAFSDALDGAMARTRHQITDWGIVFDPMADKLLIGSVAFILISKFISPLLAGFIIFIELSLIVFAYWRFRGKLIPARLVGKLKMIFQCFGVGFLLLALVTNMPILITVATYLLCFAVILAVLSLFVYRSI